MTNEKIVAEAMANHDKHYWALVQVLKRKKKNAHDLADLIGEGSTVASAIWNKYENFDFTKPDPSGEPPQPRCPRCGSEALHFLHYRQESSSPWVTEVECHKLFGGCGYKAQILRGCELKNSGLPQFFGPSAPQPQPPQFTCENCVSVSICIERNYCDKAGRPLAAPVTPVSHPHMQEVSQGIFTSAVCTCPNQADEDGSQCPICGKSKVAMTPVSANGTEPPVCDCCGAGLMLDRGGFYDCFACGHNREKAEPKDDEGLDVVSILTNACQVFDGWRQDGTDWSEWDESVRKDLGELLAWFINANIKRSHFRAGAASHNGQGWVRVGEICGQDATLDADFVGCGKPIADPYKVFRCTDCGVPFHLECAKKHFENGDVLTEEVIQAQGRRWKERGLCEGCGQTAEQCRCVPAPPSEANGPRHNPSILDCREFQEPPKDE